MQVTFKKKNTLILDLQFATVTVTRPITLIVDIQFGFCNFLSKRVECQLKFCNLHFKKNTFLISVKYCLSPGR